MKTLEALLRERLSDSRAMTAVLNINSDRVYLDFGDIGALERARLKVEGNRVIVVAPVGIANSQRAEDEAKGARRRGPIETTIGENERIFANEGGNEIVLPEGMILVSEGDLARLMDKADGVNGGDGDASQPVNPDDHSKEELISIAKTEGVEIKPNDTKAEIASAINAARAVE